MTMNKTWLAAIAIALASPLPVSATCHYPIPLSFDMCAENASCRDLLEYAPAGMIDIDEVFWLLETLANTDFGRRARDSNSCILISSSIGVVITCPLSDPDYPDGPYCLGIWEFWPE